MTKTAVVILNYNGEKLLPEFLPSVVEHSKEAEVFVADNASTDGSIELLRTHFPSVRIVSLESNFGFCGGYNRALSMIDADYFVLLNSDVQVTHRWLEPMIHLLDTDPNVAAVQPKILSYRNKRLFEYAGAAGGFIDSLGYPFCRGRIFGHLEEDTRQYDDERPIFWATGACFIIRASVFKTFKGLDEDLFAHMEEIDLCWKINRTGKQVMYTGASTVFHLGAGTLGYDSPKKVYLNFRNNLILIYKHLDSSELWYKLPFRIILDWLASLVFLFQGKFTHSMNVLRAHVHFFRSIHKSRVKRSSLQEVYPSYSRNSIYKGSILFDYYLRGIKKYPSNPK